jgi:two-component system cell cycle sensor histidine kinase/response regulator CckA
VRAASKNARRAADPDPSESASELKVADGERRLRSLYERLRVLERERQKLSALLHHTDAGFLSFDGSLKVGWTNEVFGRRFGGASGAGSILGRTCNSILCARPEPCEECPAAKALSSGKVAHHEMRLETGGESRDIYVTAMPIRSLAGLVDETIVMLQDVSDLRVLRQSEARKGAILDTALDAILTIDHLGKVTEFNRAAEKMFGYSRAEAMGREMAELIIPENLRERHRAGLEQTVRTGESRMANRRLEMTAMRRDGTEFPVEIIITRIPLPGAAVFTGYVRDLSERRKAEEALRKSEEQLRQSQKMEAVGLLAGGIAHDFNNLLTVIGGRCDLLRLRHAVDDSTRKELEVVKDATARATALTHQLLAFSRRQVLAPKVLNLNTIISDLLPMLQRLIGEDINLGTKLGPNLGHVKADPGQIEQVVMNLAVNARDAMAQGGKLLIETQNADVDEAYARQHVPTLPGRYVMLVVSDNGSGMNRETQARIFEPFFTTKEQGKGTGLGLATVYGIVKQSGGYIWVYSEVGHGTTFKIYVPRVDEEIAPEKPPRAPIQASGVSETILLVEDEEIVRSLAREILETRGYRVLEAQGGREALQICERYEDVIHLVLTDVVMPEMSGRVLAGHLAKVRPAAKVLYMSGYMGDAIARHGMLEAGVAYLQKPFTIESLTQKVREVLDRPAP